MSTVPPDVLCTDKIKLDESFLESQALILEYQFPLFWRELINEGEESYEIVYIRQDILAKHAKKQNLPETICIILGQQMFTHRKKHSCH